MAPINAVVHGEKISYAIQLTLSICFLLLPAIGSANPPGHAAKRRFTVADDIELTHFGDPYSGKVDPVSFSPDGQYFVVDTERGRLDLNRPESVLRVYRTEDIHRLLERPKETNEPAPVFAVTKSTYKDGPIITRIRWLADSTGVAFLAKTEEGNDQLFLANLNSKSVIALTPESQHVTGFDIRDQDHFVYSVLSSIIPAKLAAGSQGTSIVATGLSLEDLIFPEVFYPFMHRWHSLSDMWAVVNGARFPVIDKSSGQPVHLQRDGQKVLALSPDGALVVTALPLRTIPGEWETLYHGPASSDRHHLTGHQQDVEAIDDDGFVSQYVMINLVNGDVKPLTFAPMGNSVGWFGDASADWSQDSKSVVLSNTFLAPNAEVTDGQFNRPCLAVVDITSGESTCLERVKGQLANGSFEEDFRVILDVRFALTEKKQVIAHYVLPSGWRVLMTYLHAEDGSWKAESKAIQSTWDNPLIRISIRQDLNEPSVLVATDKQTNISRVILDPNPQLKYIDFGESSVFRWKDKTGRDWIGGLHKPPDYVPGKRYPLVIQNHGFHEHEFCADGVYPTAFAAKELAAEGILVLQIRDCEIRVDPNEGPCQVDGYEAAVKQLVADGLVDPDRVGIIGFSRTCYYVLETLTTSAVHFAAASITDGVNEGYLQYLTNVDQLDNGMAGEADKIIGARPFGDGLQVWLQRSPEFNADKITTPLQVVALGRYDLLFMWEPYAALRYLRKPVDLILLVQDTTHVLTNPAQRMVSQGGTVDWFRFWLKGEEEPDPTKAEQYKRWREMRKMQEQNESKVKDGTTN